MLKTTARKGGSQGSNWWTAELCSWRLCSRAFLVQFASIGGVAADPGGVSKRIADGVEVAGVCVYPRVDGQGDTNGGAFCSAVYRATPLCVSFTTKLRGSLRLLIFSKTQG